MVRKAGGSKNREFEKSGFHCIYLFIHSFICIFSRKGAKGVRGGGKSKGSLLGYLLINLIIIPYLSA